LDQAKIFGLLIEPTQVFEVKNLTIFNSSGQTPIRLFYQYNRNGLFNGSQETLREKRPVVVLKFSGIF
jgi:hypothetical protein